MFWFVVLLRLGFGGVLTVSAGNGLDCLGYPFMMGPFSISSLLLLMPGGIVSPPTSVVGRGFGVVLFLIMLDPCSYSSLLMSGVETGRCSGGSFLEGREGLEWYSP